MATQVATSSTALVTETTPVRERRRFNVAEYCAMAAASILAAQERVELLDGEIVVMAPNGNRHQSCVDRLGERFTLELRGRAHVRVQGPVRLDDRSEPQPDIALLRRRYDYYATGHPGPEDVLLLVEVADSTLELDRGEKLQLYARAGIPEVWIVNLQERRVESYTDPTSADPTSADPTSADPTSDGYSAERHFETGDSVAPLRFPDVALEVERIIPA